MNASQQFIEMIRQAELRVAAPEASVSFGYAHFFTAHAAAMDKIGKLPKGRKYGRNGECYGNATRLSWDEPSLLYAEGYAVSGDLPIPLLHGWCVDERTLEVIDPTWPEGHDYYGIVFRRAWVTRFAKETGHYGILDNWKGMAGELRDRMVSGDLKRGTWRHGITDLFIANSGR